jgi:hypothetical protein
VNIPSELTVTPAQSTSTDLLPFELREHLAQLRVILPIINDAAIALRRQNADGQRIVNAVKADPEEGDDGEVYVAMGYVRKRDRKTGLTQRKREGKTAEVPSPEGMQKQAAGS